MPSYAFNKDLERQKHILHDIVVFNDELALMQFNLENNFNFNLSSKADWNSRRLEISSNLRKLIRFKQLEQLQQLQRLVQLEQLQRLKQLEQLETFIITNQDFHKVKIETPVEETIIYLDPPYINTGGYGANFNHLELYDYMKKSNYDCFLSEYQSPFVSILEIPRRKMFCKKSRNKEKAIEKLFLNI